MLNNITPEDLLVQLQKLVKQLQTAGMNVGIRPCEYADPTRVEIVLENVRFTDGWLRLVKRGK